MVEGLKLIYSICILRLYDAVIVLYYNNCGSYIFCMYRLILINAE